ncbi:DUF3810 domain-containing protein [Lutibacter sp. TH_r2]|uniref:DUF3810 domain-containing protein n=1 Tax=Lutibacter sp. TH_r2 TaxID=3082083 RepID=UPI002953EDFE|nr:DUF3810 domain-containing protein [Lutibacter sp. TH_r2]MDV7187570.1 DUF3810 domain-containing protein [Lutibacter sp. TH_r2]
MNNEKKYQILSVFLVFQWAFYQFIAHYPMVIEKYYSNGLYILISKIFRVVFGWIPFSVGDFIYFFGGVLIVYHLRKYIKSNSFKFKNLIFRILGTLSVIYFLFNISWGLNYYRIPVEHTLNFKNEKFSTKDLVQFTEQLIYKINKVQVEITKNDTLIVQNPDNKSKILNQAFLSYNSLAKEHQRFSISNKSVKKSLFSLPLTYMGFAGYLNPFSGEAQVNKLIPKNNFAATSCHEIAHQTGIGLESEANFVGYLAATNYNNNYFKYSGYLLALRYCLTDVYRLDEAKFNELKALINKGILKDIKQSQDFYKSYQNWSEEYFKFFYDSFLKANQQKDGIKSYHKMVSLLINYHKTVPL